MHSEATDHRRGRSGATHRSTLRVVMVTRPSEYTGLIARHATRAQAAFFLSGRDQTIDEVEERHAALVDAVQRVSASIPTEWRRTHIERSDLDRFLFDPDDIVVAIGQDGLVANLAKYLDGQLVIGIDPEPGRNAGVLVPFEVNAAKDLFADASAGRSVIEERSMVQARMDDGGSLYALNEIFIGQPTHQSARYRIELDGQQERQSSSGIIVASGTGATGWASSILRERSSKLAMPARCEQRLAFFVREAWPSVATGTTLTEGILGEGKWLRITSEMEAGVIFGDGIEADRLDFGWGRPVELGLAERRLRLVQSY
ncbi:MAG: NAD kinase [Planctomycetota bacterium]|jgi:NAD kinase